MSAARDGRQPCCHLHFGHSPPELPFRDGPCVTAALGTNTQCHSIVSTSSQTSHNKPWRREMPPEPVQVAGVQETGVHPPRGPPASMLCALSQGSMFLRPERVTFSTTAIGKCPHAPLSSQSRAFLSQERKYTISHFKGLWAIDARFPYVRSI